MQQRGVPPADACRVWMEARALGGSRFLVPEIADYEVRRELVRLNAHAAIARLDAFSNAVSGRYLPLTTVAMRRAADLWADARRRGRPTADRHALDGDAILAAQILSAGFDPAEFIVATTNVTHLSMWVPAEEWQRIGS